MISLIQLWSGSVMFFMCPVYCGVVFDIKIAIECFQKRLPGNPLILLVPEGPTHSTWSHSKRAKNWNTQLSGMGKLIPVTLHAVQGGTNMSQCLEHLIGAVRTKVREVGEYYCFIQKGLC